MKNDDVSQGLLVSLLTFGRLDNVSRLLVSLLPMLERFSATRGVSVGVAVRNNDPTVDVSQLISDLSGLGGPGVAVNVITGQPNTGFGRGHNENLRLHPAEYILILNDDLGFPHLNWLPAALAQFEADPELALIGDDGNPQYLNPTFGNGVFPDGAKKYPLRYAEASVLLGRATLLQKIGMFDESFAWAMCEDADLSLAVQSLGYRIGWMRMPHEHLRSATFKRLSPQVKSSIEERNRARLFAKWSNAMSSGVVGRHTLLDLWSDGAGDVFCALPHLLAELDRSSPARQAQFVVNTSHPDLLRAILPEPVEVISHRDLDDLIRQRKRDSFAAIRSIRALNYGLPTNMHALLAGALSLPVADAAAMQRFQARLREVCGLRSSFRVDGAYCVFHSEFLRDAHDGRAMSPQVADALLRAACERFESVVVVGREVSVPLGPNRRLPGKIIDLQGKLSSFDLVSVIGAAAAHVGIDSFPAHVAQAMGVPAIVFFGSVHPQARLWSNAASYPLVAELSCLGCYHLHIEPSIPFCMRRDRACERDVSAERIREAFERIAPKPDATVSSLSARWHELQARQIEMQAHHPNPGIATARPANLPQESIASLIYEVTDRIVGLYESHRASRVVPQLEEQLQRVRERLAETTTELNERKAELEPLRLRNQNAARALCEVTTNVNIDLGKLGYEALRCKAERVDDDFIVEALESDPQLVFEPVELGRGLAYVRIEAVATEPNSLELFWAEGEEPFDQLKSARIAIGPRRKTEVIKLDIASPGKLRLRLDPLEDLCEARVKVKARILGRNFFDVAPVEEAGALLLEPASPETAAPPVEDPSSRIPAGKRPAPAPVKRRQASAGKSPRTLVSEAR